MGVEDLRELVAGLRETLPAAAEAAARTCAVLKGGGRPETSDVDLILRAMTDFDGARMRLAELRPEGEVPETLEALSQATDAVAAEASRGERLRKLAGVQGPATLEGILEEVRRAASTAGPQELELLAELIELAAEHSDFQELDRAAELARERLPDRWRPLINAALNQRLHIGDPDLRRPTFGNETGMEIAEADTAPRRAESATTGPAAPPAVPVPAVSDPTDAGPTGASSGVSGPTEVGSAVPDPTEASPAVSGLTGAGPAASGPGVSGPTEAVPAVSGSTEVGPVALDLLPREDTEPMPLGAPPAFGTGTVDASEIVLEFAEPIADPSSAGYMTTDGLHLPAARTGLQEVGPRSADAPHAEPEPQPELRADQPRADHRKTDHQQAHQSPIRRPPADGPDARELHAREPDVGEPNPRQQHVGERRVAGLEAGEPLRDGAQAGGAPGVVEAEAAALRTARFGLAAWLRTAAGHPAVEGQARRCAGLAREMSEFAGRLSAEFSATAQGLDGRSLARDPAGALLAWAAAIRAGIVHPTPESSRLLDELAPVVADYPGLSAYGEAFARAADSGAYLVPGGAADTRGTAQAAQNRQRAVRASLRLLEKGSHRKLTPAFVDETWRALVQQDTPLGRLLGTAARDDAARADGIADQLAVLRGGGALHRLIDETARRVAGGPVESPTTMWLGEMAGDALEVVARWVSAVKGTEATGGDTDRLGRALDELRYSIERHEVLAAAELGGPAASGGPVAAAAAGAARLLIRETLELLDGAPARPAEPPLLHLLNRELLLAPAVRIDPAAMVPYEPPALADLIPVALAPAEDWEAAFDARASAGDHEGTRGIIAVLERREPARVLPLRLRREELVRAARSARDERVRDLRGRVAGALGDGALTEETATRIEGELRELTSPARDDFGRVSRALDQLETEVTRGTSHNLKRFGGTAGS